MSQIHKTCLNFYFYDGSNGPAFDPTYKNHIRDILARQYGHNVKKIPPLVWLEFLEADSLGQYWISETPSDYVPEGAQAAATWNLCWKSVPGRGVQCVWTRSRDRGQREASLSQVSPCNSCAQGRQD
jgi:hypothetical protein